jgi:UDP-4-amino-4-deoxy-L-arabinose-oxoglutarate aminotransferase
MIQHSKPWLSYHEFEAVNAVMHSRMLVGGDKAPEFHHELLRLTGRETAAVFPTGRFALSSALTALGARPGSQVIVQTYVCEAVTWAIRKAGLVPIYCDVGEGWVSTPETVEAKITDQTCAILLTPPFGLFQSAEPFRRFGFALIHDLCQANPALLTDPMRKAGDICVFSFHPTKYLCAAGGGVVVVNSVWDRVNDRVKAIAEDLGHAMPMNELQAAIGIAQLRNVRAIRDRRHDMADEYFADLPPRSTAALWKHIDVTKGDLYRFVLREAGYDVARLQREFEKRGITVRRPVEKLMHRERGESDEGYVNAIKAWEQTISVPFYPAMSRTKIDHVIETVQSIALVRTDVEA